MNVDKNYYQILGLTKNASPEEIKKNYRELSKKYHPDINKNGEIKFKEISEAYSVIGDDNKKRSYDTQSQYGKSYNPNPFSAFSGGQGGFDDIFNTFFGGSPFSGNPFGNTYREFHENLDINVNVVITLKNVYEGKPIKVSYKRYQHCEDCGGTGFDRKGTSYECDICSGRGKDRFGRPCEYCQGLGKIYSGTCSTCKGEKIVIKDTEFNLNNIHKIRKSSSEYLKGYGHQSKYFRQKKGDLKLNIIYQHVMGYTIENDKLIYNLDIHYEDAINGMKYNYQNLDDSKIKVSIPKKTSDGDKVRLKGKGLYINHKDRGDLLFRINVVIDYDRLQKK